MLDKVLLFDSLPSTNATAYDLAQQGAPHGRVIWAKYQSDGKGRLGKKWSSPPGKGLYFSIILRPELSLEEYPKLTLTAGLAVAEVLENTCRVEVGLKWPNDVYISGKKCCGILAEANLSEADTKPFTVIGIGINVLAERHDFPEDLQGKATSLFIETNTLYSMEELLKKLCRQVLELVKEHERLGFSFILKRWKTRDFLYGKNLEWVSSSGEVMRGEALGPDDAGQMLVRDENGKIHEVLSGDLSLANKKGIINK